MQRLLGESGGVKTWWEQDPLTGCQIIRYSQDVEGIIKDNLAYQNSGHDGYSKSRDMQHVASIPLAIYIKWKEEEGIDLFDPNDREAIKRKLNDPENRFLRTGLGRI